MTHIVGSGQANKSERLLFNGSPISTGAFRAAQGPSWDNPTFDVTAPVTATQVTVSVDHSGFNSFDCLTWGAIIYRTEVKDSDGDGLLDVWESSTTPIYDPRGQALPLLSAMGADPARKDIFIEAGSMQAPADTAYGGVLQPAHTHLPSQAALKLVGDAFKNAPEPIAVHFDMGNAYPLPKRASLGGGVTDTRAFGERGRSGRRADDRLQARPSDSPWVCQFPRYPGTVGWKTGFRSSRRGAERYALRRGCRARLQAKSSATRPDYICNRRFDRNRKDMFRYALFAPRWDSRNPRTPRIRISMCHERTPASATFPAVMLMVTLGAFADAAGRPVGTPFMQASTLMHELGHDFNAGTAATRSSRIASRRISA